MPECHQKYRHFDLDSRRELYRLLALGIPVKDIAVTLDYHPSSIYREMKRNRHLDEHPPFRGYFPVSADEMARRRRARGGKIMRDQELAYYVVDKLRAFWSPEQIAGYLARHKPDARRISHETIYQYVYSPFGRELGLGRLLPSSRKTRRRRYTRRPRGCHIPEANSIMARPNTVNERSSFGHWEGDLMIFRREYGSSNMTSLVERVSRYVMLARNATRHSKGVIGGIAKRLSPLPSGMRSSITFDRGTEFAAYGDLERGLGMTSYFCKPSAPWQKGSVENTNGRLRRFLPSDTDLTLMSDSELRRIERRLNSIPRKCLGYRTPREVFAEQLTNIRGT